VELRVLGRVEGDVDGGAHEGDDTPGDGEPGGQTCRSARGERSGPHVAPRPLLAVLGAELRVGFTLALLGGGGSVAW
jgi:hypothetical protein